MRTFVVSTPTMRCASSHSHAHRSDHGAAHPYFQHQMDTERIAPAATRDLLIRQPAIHTWQAANTKQAPLASVLAATRIPRQMQRSPTHTSRSPRPRTLRQPRACLTLRQPLLQHARPDPAAASKARPLRRVARRRRACVPLCSYTQSSGRLCICGAVPPAPHTVP